MKMIVEKQGFRRYASLMSLVFVVFSLMYASVAILEEQYRIRHNNELMFVKNQWTAPDGSSSGVEYGYRINPFTIPQTIMSFSLLFLPIVVTTGFSLVYFRRAEGSLKRRFWKSMGLTLLIVPLMYLVLLPWNIYCFFQEPNYFQYDTYMVPMMLMPFYDAFIVIVSLSFNGMAYAREKKRLKTV